MTKYFTFGIDIDETLVSVFFDGEIDEKFFQKTGKPLNHDDMTDFYFENIPGLLEVYTEYLDANHDRLPFFADAKAVLQNLKNQGVRLVIITSREPHYKAGTIRYLNEVFGENFFAEILFTCDYEADDKAILAKNHNCDVVIDDAAHHIMRYLEKTNMKIIKMDAPWNREIADSDRVIGVKTWKEVEKIILDLL